MICRSCYSSNLHPILDLGASPPSNSYLSEEQLSSPESWYPLRILVCQKCWFVQTEDFAEREVFFNESYAYFSSYSDSFLKHASEYVEEMCDEYSLDTSSFVVEIAANDGYLLQYFNDKNIKSVGIEPTASTAKVARDKGIKIKQDFFGSDYSTKFVEEEGLADLVIANNVLAHVPDINDFVEGLSKLLSPRGLITIEFPHFKNLLSELQFDTVYHEHFSYLSLNSCKPIFEKYGLKVFDVKEIKTHGGSLRLFLTHDMNREIAVKSSVQKILAQEVECGLSDLRELSLLQSRAENLKNDFLRFLLDAKLNKKSVVGYGAAAKSNTILNYAGVRGDLIKFIVDKNPAKQGKFMPGSRIQICAENELVHLKPDFIIIFPWNLKEELFGQLDYVREWGCKLVTLVPELQVFE